MINILKEKQGATIIVLVLLSTILFPLILTSVMDFTNMSNIEKSLKNTLNLSTKSASSRVDWNRAPNGDIFIDEVDAKDSFVDIFNSNMNIELIPKGDYYEYKRESTGNKIKVYLDIYNERHEGTSVLFLQGSDIPNDVTSHNIKINVDRPTVAAVAVVEYKLSPLLGGRIVEITGVASSQLNHTP